MSGATVHGIEGSERLWGRKMNRWKRLMSIVVVGVSAMLLSAWGLHELRARLVNHGPEIAPIVFLAAFFVVVGGIYFTAVKKALREIRKQRSA